MSDSASGEARNRHIVIVGGGASGVLLAAHLLNAKSGGLAVTLIERSCSIGQGLAYGTTHPQFLLNVRAANMSAFADRPNHFAQWLAARQGVAAPADPGFAFAERRLYACYLASLIERYTARDGGAGRLELRRGEAMAIDIAPDAATVRLGDGTSVAGDVIVLATGNEVQPEPGIREIGSLYANPWLTTDRLPVPRTATVAIRGTGLTMIDYVVALSTSGHTGQIYALSRRGCLPQVHRATSPLHLRKEEIPFGASLLQLWCWFRRLVRDNARRGGDWRSCVDALRPYSWELWRQLSLESKQRFLRHARVWWDMHRHRMAPEIAYRLHGLTASGQLRIVAAKIAAIDTEDSELRIAFRRRGCCAIETLRADRFVDCSGVHTSPAQSANPVIRNLIAKGLARSDPLDIGLEVDTDWTLINAQGRRSRRLLAIGPLSKAGGWETTAIPDIRLQCAELTRHLLQP